MTESRRQARLKREKLGMSNLCSICGKKVTDEQTFLVRDRKVQHFDKRDCKK